MTSAKISKIESEYDAVREDIKILSQKRAVYVKIPPAPVEVSLGIGLGLELVSAAGGMFGRCVYRWWGQSSHVRAVVFLHTTC